ncbi:MAG: rhomboid family intramembrane serine protease [Polyangiaceae bacterium]
MANGSPHPPAAPFVVSTTPLGRPSEPETHRDSSADEPHPGAVLLGPFSGPRLREASLVLRSMGIHHISEPARLGTFLVVMDHDRVRALEALRRYDEENRDWPPKRERERLSYKGIPLSALAFVGLVVFAWFTGPARLNSFWFQKGTSVASLAVSGHPELTVTALTLHADATHVLGNLLSGAIFAHLVERRLGPGLGILSILLGGALGNLANAAFHIFGRGEQHASIGASTAVLAAIGVLASTQFLVTRETSRKRSFQDWAVPVVGGLALLGSIGASPESDLGAHGFGFLAGFVVGAILFVAFKSVRTRIAAQAVFGGIAAALVSCAWLVALRR